MHPRQLKPVSGHVYRVERRRGPVWYAKYRLPDGRQVKKQLGPEWPGKGPPPPGYFATAKRRPLLRRS